MEDTHVFETARFLDASGPDHLQYFANFITWLNVTNPALTADPFKIQKVEPDPIRRAIDKLQFGCGHVAVHKLERTHWAPVEKT